MSQISDVLVGKTIQQYEIGPCGDHIKFTFTDGGSVQLDAYGDCCSTTWVESIDAPEALYGKVLIAEQIDMPDLPYDENEYECVKFYGLKIVTDKGHAVIDYRNSSNGYYGGSLDVGEIKEGGTT